MRISKLLIVVTLISVLSFLPTAGWAMMCCESHEGSHGSHQGHQGSHESHGDHQEQGNLHEPMDVVFSEYFAIQSQLANDSMEGISGRAEAIAEAVEGEHEEAMKGGQAHGADMHAMTKTIADSAKSLSKKGDIASAREEFGKLSEEMIKYYDSLGDKPGVKAYVFTCGMAQKSWLQKDENLRNPYYGSSMLKCGKRVK